MKEKIKKFWAFLRKEVINKEMIAFLIIAEAIFWSPCIVTGILAIVIDSRFWTAFGGYIAFWSFFPCTPAIPLQIGLAFGLKKLYEKIRRNKQ